MSAPASEPSPSGTAASVHEHIGHSKHFAQLNSVNHGAEEKVPVLVELGLGARHVVVEAGGAIE